MPTLREDARLARLVRRARASRGSSCRPGAVDAHCHVFGPGAEFPYAPERKYTPCDASKEQLFALRDHLGFARNVDRAGHLPRRRQPRDGRRAAAQSDGRARGVATVRRERHRRASCSELHDAGVRGVRFNFVKRLVDFTPRGRAARRSPTRIAPLGWHVVVYFEARDLPELWDFFTALPTTVVVDHMGRPDVTQAGRRPRVRAVPASSCASTTNIWSQGQLPRAAVGQRAAGARRRAQRLPRRRAVRAPRRRDLPRPRALGHRLAAPEPEGPHARRRAAGRLHPAHRADARAAAASCWSTTRCASTGRRRC